MDASWSARFRSGAKVTREADRALVAVLDSWPLGAETAHRVQLVVSELVSNASEHGYEGREQGEIAVDVRLTPLTVQIVVEDQGRGLSQTHPAALPEDPSAARGRGLYIVQQLSEVCVVKEGSAGGTRVEVEIARTGSDAERQGDENWPPHTF